MGKINDDKSAEGLVLVCGQRVETCNGRGGVAKGTGGVFGIG